MFGRALSCKLGQVRPKELGELHGPSQTSQAAAVRSASSVRRSRSTMGTSCLVQVVAIVDRGVFGFGFVCGVYDRLLACALEGRDDIIESLTK